MAHNKRIAWIDNAKGIGILLVVLGHSPMLSQPDLNWIHHLVFLFHMPLFFVLAGVVHKHSGLLPHVRGRIRSILVPYLFTGALFAAINLALYDRPLASAAKGLLLGIAPYAPQPQLWFLTTLFAASVATVVLTRVTLQDARWLRVGIRVVAVLVMALAGLAILEHNTLGQRFNGPQYVFYVWPWNLDLLPLALAFYLLGYWYQVERGMALPGVFQSGMGAASIVVLAAAMLFYAMKPGHADMDLFLRIAFGPWVLPAALAGIALVLALSQQVRGGMARVLQYLGQRSLVIFLFHFMPQSVIVNNLGASFLSASSGFVGAILLSLALDWLIRRSRLLSLVYYPSSSITVHPPSTLRQPS